MDSKFHSDELHRRCRVCGEVIRPPTAARPVSSYADTLSEAFGIKIDEDTEGVHPLRICVRCAATAQGFVKPTASGKKRRMSLELFDWRRHDDDSCSLCDDWRQQARTGLSRRAPKGRGTKRGRPPASESHDSEGTEGEVKSDPSVEVGDGLDELTGEGTSQELTGPPAVRICPDPDSRLTSYKTDMSLDPNRFVSELTDALICPICRDVVDEPVAAPHPDGCEHACCRRCWQAWLEVSDECPCCQREITPEELHPLSRYLRSTLSGLLLHCDHWQRGCSAVVKLEELQTHVKECAFKLHPLLPEDIISPRQSPTCDDNALDSRGHDFGTGGAAAQPTGAQGSGLTDQTAGRGKGHNRWFADFHRRQAPAYILYTNVSDWKQVSVPQDERAKAPCHLAGAGSRRRQITA